MTLVSTYIFGSTHLPYRNRLSEGAHIQTQEAKTCGRRSGSHSRALAVSVFRCSKLRAIVSSAFWFLVSGF